MKRLFCSGVVLLAAGCLGGGSRGGWAEWPPGGEAERGLRLRLQTARSQYVKGKKIPLRARIESVGESRRPIFLDLGAGWAEATVELDGPSGRVPVTKKELHAKRAFKAFNPGDSSEWKITNLRTAAWKMKLPLRVGKYKATLVYQGRLGPEWNKMAAAGGDYEGESLWEGELRSNEIEFEVVEPPGKKKKKEKK